MKASTVVLSVALLATLLAMTASASLYVDSSVATEFAKFKKTYNKQYSAAEEEKRMRNFEENLRVAKTLQATNPKATFGVTKFFDMSARDFARMYANGAASFAESKADSMLHSLKTSKRVKATEDTPDSVDWRKSGVVSPIKDQGQCGSCWAFSAIGNIEGQWAMAGNDLVNMSEQQLVSCDFFDLGCNGGLMQRAFLWLIYINGGVTYTEESYPYTSGDGSFSLCIEFGREDAGRISDYEFIEKDEDVMAAWVAQNGPLSVAVDATTFQYYTGGVVTDCSNEAMNHGVLIVGYDNTYNPPYWTIKNSWGADWGEDGYIRIEKGTNACLVTEYPISSIVDNSNSSTSLIGTATKLWNKFVNKH